VIWKCNWMKKIRKLRDLKKWFSLWIGLSKEIHKKCKSNWKVFWKRRMLSRKIKKMKNHRNGYSEVMYRLLDNHQLFLVKLQRLQVESIKSTVVSLCKDKSKVLNKDWRNLRVFQQMINKNNLNWQNLTVKANQFLLTKVN